MLRRRRSEGSNKAKGVLAVFWIALAAVSALYLFTLVTNPAALGGQTAASGLSFGDATSALSASSGSSLTAEQLSDMLAARDKELAEIKQTLHELSQQVAELTGHKPAEADAAAPAASPATQTAPAQAEAAVGAPASKKPEAAAAAPAITPPPPPEKPEPVVKPAEAKVPEKPAAPEQTVAAAEPKAEAKPEPKPATVSAPPVTGPESADSDSNTSKIPPPVTVSEAEVPPIEETAKGSDVSSPAPPQASSPGAADAASTPAATPPAAETAALDPVALPPAANDGTTRYGIEIGTVAKQDALRPLWRTFLTNHAALVAGLQPRRVLAPDKKWRLIAGPFASAAEANQACALFKKAAQPCEATVYAGDSL